MNNSPETEVAEKATSATVMQLKDIVFPNWRVPQDCLNEVYPGIYIGDEIAAKDTELLKRMKMTHILNAAWSENASLLYVNTSQGFYTLRNCDCIFFGIRAVDSPTFKLARHFEECTEFIDKALSVPSGKVLVHCRQGVSRSATLVIVYLMQKKNMTAKEAVSMIRKKRNIFPNMGFMKEICLLDESLLQSRLEKAKAEQSAIENEKTATEENAAKSNEENETSVIENEGLTVIENKSRSVIENENECFMASSTQSTVIENETHSIIATSSESHQSTFIENETSSIIFMESESQSVMIANI